MNKKLKNFIEENRRAFDDELPSPGAWDRIESTIRNKPGKTRSIKAVYKWSAAAAILFIIAGAAYWLVINKK
jgi:hypothetical protein